MSEVENLLSGAPAATAPAAAAKAKVPEKTKAELLAEETAAIALENAKMDREFKLLELEEKRLTVEAAKANLQDTRERLDERQLKRGVLASRSKTNGATISALAANAKKVQNRCNHKKGGNGIPGYVGGQGNDSNYAVMKHTMCWGDTWIRCMRCGKTWKPPVEKFFDSKEEYIKEFAEYQAALNYQTNNSGSSSYQFRYSDNGAFAREVMQPSTLR
jgi:hypothetical protein